MKISEAFDAYGRYMLLEGRSERMIEHNDYIKRKALEYLGDIRLEDLNIDHIYAWKKEMYYKVLSNGKKVKRMPNSLRCDIIVFRGMLRHMERIGKDCMDYRLIPIPKHQDIERTFLTANEVNQMIECAYSLRNKFIISLLYSSGIRLSEFLSLDRNSIQDRSFTVIGKGKKLRLCFIDKRTEDLMGEYLARRNDDCPALVVSELYKQRMTATNIQLIIRNSAKRANIDKHVTPHVFRHSFATNFIENDGGIKPLAELLGHNSLNTTSIYTHIKNNQLKRCYDKFHSV